MKNLLLINSNILVSLLWVVGSSAALAVEDLNDLVYDSNSKLSTHYLFYLGKTKDDCSVITNWREDNGGIPYGYTVQPLKGNALQAVFPEYYDSQDPNNDDDNNGSKACPVACVERGTDQSLVHAVLPNKKHYITTTSSSNSRQDSDMEYEEMVFLDWFGRNCQTVDVCLLNYYDWDNPINVWWVDDSQNNGDDDDDDGDGEWHHQMELEYGSENTGCFQSQLGHRFIITGAASVDNEEEIEEDSEEEDIIIDDFIIEHNVFKAFGKGVIGDDITGIDFEKQVLDTLQDNWDNHKEVKRTFSALGFKKGRLPDDVFASMSAFYYNNRNNMAREEWTIADGPYVNWWEVDCSYIEIPRTLKLIWQERLRQLVEDWAGVPIEQTDCYGMRQYNEGSRLLTHVDRVTTHAASLIVNVAQGNLTNPWPVEINDHENRLHQFILEPGEILYYESAKCLHGRNQPLQGPQSYYVNLFTHYRPTGDPNWYLKPNPEGMESGSTPGNGICNQLDATPGEAASQECSSGQGSHTVESASDFRATSAADLVRWWRLTGGDEEGHK